MAAVPLLQHIANETLAIFFERAALINAVTRDFIEDAVAEKGESVVIITPESPSVEDGDAAFVGTTVSPANVVVTLDQFKRTAPQKLGDKVNSLSSIDLAAAYAPGLADSLLRHVETALFAVTNFAAAAGVNATPPTGLGPLVTDLWAKFETMQLPISDRNVVLNPTAAAEYFKAFPNLTGTVGQSQMLTGSLGYAMGMKYMTSPLVTAGNAGVGFSKSAIALALRAPKITDPANQAVAVAPGMGIRVTKWADHKDAAVYLKADILFGVKKLNERGFIIHE